MMELQKYSLHLYLDCSFFLFSAAKIVQSVQTIWLSVFSQYSWLIEDAVDHRFWRKATPGKWKMEFSKISRRVYQNLWVRINILYSTKMKTVVHLSMTVYNVYINSFECSVLNRELDSF